MGQMKYGRLQAMCSQLTFQVTLEGNSSLRLLVK